MNEKSISEKIVEAKDLIRKASIILSALIGTKEFENRKDFYQDRIIDAIKHLNSTRESL